MSDSVSIPVNSNTADMIKLFGKLNLNNSCVTYEESDNSFVVDIKGLMKFDFSIGKYTLYLTSLNEKLSDVKSSSIELLNSMDGIIIDEKRIINNGKQVEFLLRCDVCNLTFSQLNIIKQNLHPLEINIYKASEIKNHLGEYYLGLVFDFDDDTKLILESSKN